MKLFHSKKGEGDSTSAAPETLLKLVLVVVVILIILLFATDLWGAIKPRNADDYTKNQFDQLKEDVQSLIDDQKTFSSYTSTYSIAKDYFIAGFDYNMQQQLNNVQALNPIYTTKYPKIYKPDQCYDVSNKEERERACLCLYKGDVDSSGLMKSEKRLRCYKFPGKVVFLGRMPDGEKNKGLQKTVQPIAGADLYEYLFLYSEADNTINDLYVEKYREGDTTYIYITLNLPKLKYMFNSYHKCPENSEALCLGKHFDQTLTAEEVITFDPGKPISGEASFICTYDESEGKCVLRQFGQCPEEVFEPCACEGALRYTGLCIDNKHYSDELLCAKVEKCEDYCSIIEDPNTVCNDEEIGYCQSDPCKKSCKPNLIGGKCVTAQ